MISSLDLSGWAGEIIYIFDLSGTTTGSVTSWMRTNVGNLSLVIRKEFEVSGENAIIPEMENSELGIYTKMYECYRLTQEAKNAALLGYTDWVEVKGDDQGSVRRVSKSELSKNLISLSRICKDELNTLINEYLVSDGSRDPYQILGVSRKCGTDGQYY
jgi:hypothetical protein